MSYFSYVLMDLCAFVLHMLYTKRIFQQWHTFGLINYIIAASFVVERIKKYLSKVCNLLQTSSKKEF